jgi:hypothetical protein
MAKECPLGGKNQVLKIQEVEAEAQLESGKEEP